MNTTLQNNFHNLLPMKNEKREMPPLRMQAKVVSPAEVWAPDDLLFGAISEQQHVDCMNVFGTKSKITPLVRTLGRRVIVTCISDITATKTNKHHHPQQQQPQQQRESEVFIRPISPQTLPQHVPLELDDEKFNFDPITPALVMKTNLITPFFSKSGSHVSPFPTAGMKVNFKNCTCLF